MGGQTYVFTPHPLNNCLKNIQTYSILSLKILLVLQYLSEYISCGYKRQWLYRPNLVIRNINLNKYDIKCLNILIILSIYKKEVDNLDIKYIVNNLIKNGDVKQENVPRCGESKTDKWVQVNICLIYYRFIVLFTIGLEFLLITFLLQFFLAQLISLPISSATFSVHIYLLVDITSVYLKVAMYEGSVLSPLLFAVVMDVVPIEERSGIPSKMLHQTQPNCVTMASKQ